MAIAKDQRELIEPGVVLIGKHKGNVVRCRVKSVDDKAVKGELRELKNSKDDGTRFSVANPKMKLAPRVFRSIHHAADYVRGYKWGQQNGWQFWSIEVVALDINDSREPFKASVR